MVALSTLHTQQYGIFCHLHVIHVMARIYLMRELTEISICISPTKGLSHEICERS